MVGKGYNLHVKALERVIQKFTEMTHIATDLT